MFPTRILAGLKNTHAVINIIKCYKKNYALRALCLCLRLGLPSADLEANTLTDVEEANSKDT